MRLAIRVVLSMVVNGLLLAGPDCSSWGVPARGTSLRNWINIHGNQYLGWVRGSSTMVSRLLGLCYSMTRRLSGIIFATKLRLVLLLQRAMARNCCWAVEQPDKSLLIRHRRKEWLVNHVAFVF